jgi:SAM-dependent methyltransferase
MAGRDDSASDHGSSLTGVGNGEPAWDERYASTEQMWSGQPNSALVTEVGGLEPGRALDVGCGEGADAIWLTTKGWRVTAIDVSEVALQRAARAAEQTDVSVEWVHAGLLDTPLPSSGFDLVSAQYPALLRTPTHDAGRALVAAVGSGGHLLVVHHVLDDVDIAEAKARGFDPSDYVSPGDVAALLGEGWRVEFDERRPRQLSAGAGVRHTHDVVLHAQRLS